MSDQFSISGRFRSMRYAMNGCRVMLVEEHNSRVHLVATVLVVVFALLLDAKAFHWIVLTLAVALVWITEALNTCIENLCDLYSTDYDPRIGKIKDIAAAAVIISSVAALVCGLFVFIPLLTA